MKLALAAMACLLVTPSLAYHGEPCHADYIPRDMRAEPTVPYEVYNWPYEDVQDWCGQFVRGGSEFRGCVFDQGNGIRVVLIDDALSDEMKACVLLHEKAHMPPNNWDHSGNGWGR
jgi:hypothetical protein